jgi:hypothetical protein
MIEDPKEIEQFLIEKETRDIEFSIELRAKGIISTLGRPFELSRRTEIDGLLARGVFKMIHKDDLSIGATQVFRSRMVNEVKGKETATPYKKSRLVV